MRAALIVAVVAAVSAAPRTAVKDGSVASAAFRGEPSDAALLPWQDHDASGTAAKQRRHDASAFDQIIVETLEQPAKHRPSAALIIFIFITSLFMGAVLLLLCIVCFLKAFHGQIAYQSVTQKDDRLCVLENRGRPLADVLFNKRPLEKSTQTKEVRDEVRRDFRSSSFSAPNRFEPEYTKESSRRKTVPPHDRPPAFDATDPECPRESDRRRAMAGYGAPTADNMAAEYARESARRKATSRAPSPSRSHAHQRQDYDNEELNYDETECPQALSNLQLNLRINQDRPSGRNRNVSWGYKNQAHEGSSVTSVSAGEEYGPSTKSRPLMFSLNPDKKASRPRDGRSLVADPKAPRAKEVPSVWHANSKESIPSSEVDENFFGEQNASEVFQAIKSTKVGRGPRSNAESTQREFPTQQLGSRATTPGSTRQQPGSDTVTKDQLMLLIDELLSKKGPEKRGREGE